MNKRLLIAIAIAVVVVIAITAFAVRSTTPTGVVTEPTLGKVDSTPRVAVESAFSAELVKLLAETTDKRTCLSFKQERPK